MNTNLVFTQVCSPTFKEIYDFQVGDYFKFQNNNYLDGGGSLYNDFITESYIITGRQENGDSIYYKRLGVVTNKHVQAYTASDTIIIHTTIINDTILYIDSPDNFLNKCSGTLVNTYNYMELSPNNYYEYCTIIKIIQNDSLLKKAVGGNFFIVDSTGSIIDTVDYMGNYASHEESFQQDRKSVV